MSEGSEMGEEFALRVSTRPATWLCPVCTYVFQQTKHYGKVKRVVPDVQTLEGFRQAALDKCFVCYRIWNIGEGSSRAWVAMQPDA
ncbi:hypothetical protein CDEST_00291 [Colletotrichum destructivum]|uniref:Mut7-C RNAse domain-containing protein n=1 Tax=Colletotrichum destructivum TaxID=34406 RepID=A0AAX4HW24_9PEZI|nr:hypothetical protein CDEST_00291 [Colletotrichum destructivum]